MESFWNHLRHAHILKMSLVQIWSWCHKLGDLTPLSFPRFLLCLLVNRMFNLNFRLPRCSDAHSGGKRQDSEGSVNKSGRKLHATNRCFPMLNLIENCFIQKIFNPLLVLHSHIPALIIKSILWRCFHWAFLRQLQGWTDHLLKKKPCFGMELSYWGFDFTHITVLI